MFFVYNRLFVALGDTLQTSMKSTFKTIFLTLSHSGSRADVASSRSNILGFLINALAIAILCF